jgi:hypothetical protein
VKKRLFIAAITIVAIGATVFGYSRYRERRQNSIAYHKADYIAARDGRPTLMQRFWGRLTGRTVYRSIPLEKLRRHEQALFRLGYWREQTVVVSNMPASTAWGIAVKHGAHLWQPPFSKEACVVAPTGTNTILVRAVPDHLPLWERLIRDADCHQLK